MRTILPIEQNSVLREIAREIPLADILSARIKKLIAEMKSLLSKEKYGVAIAAAQVGEPLRLFIVSGKALGERSKKKIEVVDPSQEVTRPDISDQIYINPVLTKVSRSKKEKHEGCLSIRGKWGMVPRSEKATITAYDEHGKKFTRGASGFLAHIFQHEMDHLSGILYTDKAREIYEEELGKNIND
ncbi:MAG: peptide deformylase [bacterium]|nr:peptide deformylase [bacterium]